MTKLKEPVYAYPAPLRLTGGKPQAPGPREVQFHYDGRWYWCDVADFARDAIRCFEDFVGVGMPGGGPLGSSSPGFYGDQPSDEPWWGSPLHQCTVRAAQAKALWDHFDELRKEFPLVTWAVELIPGVSPTFPESASTIKPALDACDALTLHLQQSRDRIGEALVAYEQECSADPAEQRARTQGLLSVVKEEVARIPGAVTNARAPVEHALKTMLEYQGETIASAGNWKTGLEATKTVSFAIVSTYATGGLAGAAGLSTAGASVVVGVSAVVVEGAADIGGQFIAGTQITEEHFQKVAMNALWSVVTAGAGNLAGEAAKWVMGGIAKTIVGKASLEAFKTLTANTPFAVLTGEAAEKLVEDLLSQFFQELVLTPVKTALTSYAIKGDQGWEELKAEGIQAFVVKCITNAGLSVLGQRLGERVLGTEQAVNDVRNAAFQEALLAGFFPPAGTVPPFAK